MKQKKITKENGATWDGIVFSDDLENMINADLQNIGAGYMQGSLSGESWKMFLVNLRCEAVNRLKTYRDNGSITVGFRASSLQPYCEERMRIEREYVRGLVSLYGKAERAYKSLTG